MSLWGDKMPDQQRKKLERFYSVDDVNSNRFKTQSLQDYRHQRLDPECGGFNVPWGSIRQRSQIENSTVSSPKPENKNYLYCFGDYLLSSTANKLKQHPNITKLDQNPYCVEIPPDLEQQQQQQQQIKSSSLNSDDSNSSNLSGDSTKQLCDKLILNKQINANEIKKTNENQQTIQIAQNERSCSELNSFLLPRVIILNNTNSSNTSSNSNEDSGFERCYDKSGRDTHNHHLHHQMSQSQYSTEKSGSSGYYGSNLYSTGSFEEHIYSEPVIEKYDRKSQLGQTVLRRPQIVMRHELSEVTNYDENLEFLRKKIDKLPTIMEGIDGQIPRPVWPSDYDDSLVDINLESFRPNNENSTPNLYQKTGITNPAFEFNETDNSSPDQEFDHSLGIYLKNYEENVCVQQTRDILEEIRTKLNELLEQHNLQVPSNNNNKNSDPFRSPSPRVQRKNFECEIFKLKNDLDGYLKVINKENEKEIKQLCTGLARDTKIITLKNAMENKSRSSIYEDHVNQTYNIYDLTEESGYEQMRPRKSISLTSNYQDTDQVGLNFGTVYVRDGFNLADTDCQNNINQLTRTTSIRSSDPNVHFQRKPSSIYSTNQLDITRILNTNSSANSSSETNSDLELSSDNNNLKQNLQMQHHPVLIDNFGKSLINNSNNNNNNSGDKDMILELHKNKPSIWELYYGKNRPHQTIVKKVRVGKNHKIQSIVSYPSTRPESDFTLDMPRAEQLRKKMEKEKQFRHWCRIFMTLLSFVFFILTVMVVSLLLTRGERMFGSML